MVWNDDTGLVLVYFLAIEVVLVLTVSLTVGLVLNLVLKARLSSHLLLSAMIGLATYFLTWVLYYFIPKLLYIEDRIPATAIASLSFIIIGQLVIRR